MKLAVAGVILSINRCAAFAKEAGETCDDGLVLVQRSHRAQVAMTRDAALQTPEEEEGSAEDDEIVVDPDCVQPYPDSKQIAVLLTGESYRASHHQLERDTCTDMSIEAQRNASKSHIENFVKPLEASGYKVSLFGSTYACTQGGSQTDELPSLYESYMKDFSIIAKSSEEFGGQINSYQKSMELALASSVAYDYYLIVRWDLSVADPVDLSCALDQQPTARHLGHLFGFNTEDAMGNFNSDWMMMVPGQLSQCAGKMMQETPEECCSHRCMGPACFFCIDNLNKKAGITTDPRLTQGTCPAEPISFARPLEQYDDSVDPEHQDKEPCKCCEEIQ